MVQLKVCINGTYKEFDLISIPHGTIKRLIHLRIILFYTYFNTSWYN